MPIVLILTCWVSTIFYFFGRKILALYDVLIDLVTHFMPLGPILLAVLVVGLIIASAPKRPASE